MGLVANKEEEESLEIPGYKVYMIGRVVLSREL